MELTPELREHWERQLLAAEKAVQVAKLVLGVECEQTTETS